MLYALDGPDIMEAVVLDWEKVGIKSKRFPEATSSFGPKSRNRKTNKTHWVYGSPPFDEPMLAWARVLHSKGAFNLLCDGPYDEDIETAMREFDPDKRAKLSHDLGQKLCDNYHGVMIGMKTITWVLSKKVSNWQTLAYVPAETNYEYVTFYLSGSLSIIQGMVGCGAVLTGEPEKRLESRHRRSAPVEAEDKLIEVVGQMFPAHAAVSAPDPRLEVGKDPVDPREQYRGRFRRSLRRRPMVIPALLERGVALPAVRPNRAPSGHRGFDEPNERRARHVGHDPESDSAGATATNFHRGHDDRLPAVAPPTAGTALLRAAEIGLVHFDDTGDAVAVGSDHCATELLQHDPRRFIPSQTELSLELQRGEPRRVRGHQIGRPEPVAQSHARPMHHGPRRNRNLVATGSALQQHPARHRIGLGMFAPRTSIPVRPARLDEVPPARIRRGKPPLEFGEGLREVGTRHLPSSPLTTHHNILGYAESTG